MSIKYIKLPIYSIALYGQYLYFSGGGGGSTGIPNQIKIYHRAITPEPIESVPTDRYIIENLTTCQEKGLLVCNANEWIVVYKVTDAGRQLSEAYRFQADFSPKHPNVNALCLTVDASVVMAAGQDQRIRFFSLGTKNACLLYEHGSHSHQIKSVDHNQHDLFVSTDNHLLVVCSLANKEIIRTVHQDQLLPEKTFFRSAYFTTKGSRQLVITHFVPRTVTYVTKELPNQKLHTIEVASDQVSQTAYQPTHQLLGVACANGMTSIVSTSSLQLEGTQNQLHSGVNACAISKKKYLISGTSNCSYHVQGPEGSLNMPWALVLSLIVTALFISLSVNGGDWEL